MLNNMLNAFKLLSAVTPERLKTGLNESYQRVKCSFSKMLLSLNRAHVILHNDLIGSQTKGPVIWSRVPETTLPLR